MRITLSNFNLEKIMLSGQCFRINDIYETDEYVTYSVVADGRYLEIDMYSPTDYDFHCSGEEYNIFWQHYFDLGSTIYPLKEIDGDDFLNESLKFGEGIRILNQDFYETLISFIISQRKSIPAIQTSIERLCEKFGSAIEVDGEVKAYAFPNPEYIAKLEPGDLDGCGLGYRAEYIIEASRWFANSYYEDMEKFLFYDELMYILMQIRGVGIKVANCTCLFGARKLNACPVDVWIQRVIDDDYNGRKPEWMNNKYAGLYQQYVFFYKRLNNKHEKKKPTENSDYTDDRFISIRTAEGRCGNPDEYITVANPYYREMGG